jgi:hypothetical protein
MTPEQAAEELKKLQLDQQKASERRGYRGPSRGTELREAQLQLQAEGVDLNEFKSKKELDTAVNERAAANREERGPMAFDTAQGRAVPSPRAAARAANPTTQEEWDAKAAKDANMQSREAEKANTAQGVLAADYWDRNPDATPTAVVKDWSDDPGVLAAKQSGDTAAVEAAVKAARGNRTAVAGMAEQPVTRDTVQGPARTAPTQTASAAGGSPVSISVDPTKPAQSAGGTPASISIDPTRTAQSTGGPSVRTVDIRDVATAAKTERENAATAAAERQQYNQQKVAEYRENLQTQRKDNELASAARFDEFVRDIDERKTNNGAAEERRKSTVQQARASARQARQAARSGKVLPDEFWDRNAELQEEYRFGQERGVDAARQRSAATIADQQEKRRKELEVANRATPSTSEFVSSLFDSPIKMSLSTLLPSYLGGRNR